MLFGVGRSVIDLKGPLGGLLRAVKVVSGACGCALAPLEAFPGWVSFRYRFFQHFCVS